MFQRVVQFQFVAVLPGVAIAISLDLAQNYLTGTLSPLIGNLTRMQWLTMGINALSGELPPELGQLSDLRLLGIGTNSFNGSLPSELGNLRRLEQCAYLLSMTHTHIYQGYLAPEYAMRGHLTEKADVFGFGVVALEIISGRPNSDPTLEDEQIYLLEWVGIFHFLDYSL
ncbi:putative protein kinase RLK-Pelle-DLSV family [Helianthus anomalus]